MGQIAVQDKIAKNADIPVYNRRILTLVTIKGCADISSHF